MHKQLMQVSKRKEKSTEHVADVQSAKAQSCTSFTNNGKLISTFSEMCMDLKMFSRHTFHYSCSEHSIPWNKCQNGKKLLCSAYSNDKTSLSSRILPMPGRDWSRWRRATRSGCWPRSAAWRDLITWLRSSSRSVLCMRPGLEVGTTERCDKHNFQDTRIILCGVWV